jgi:hypothetical protein
MSLIHTTAIKLIEDIHNNLYYYIEIKWHNNLGSIHTSVKKNKIMEHILNITNNYSRYYNLQYEVDTIIVKDIQNYNPHIKIHTSIFDSIFLKDRH